MFPRRFQAGFNFLRHTYDSRHSHDTAFFMYQLFAIYIEQRFNISSANITVGGGGGEF